MAGRLKCFVIEIFAKPDGGHSVVCEYLIESERFQGDFAVVNHFDLQQITCHQYCTE